MEGQREGLDHDNQATHFAIDLHVGSNKVMIGSHFHSLFLTGAEWVLVFARSLAMVLFVDIQSKQTHRVNNCCLGIEVSLCKFRCHCWVLTFRLCLVTLLLASSAGHAPGLGTIAEVPLSLLWI